MPETDPQNASLLGDVYSDIDPALLEQLATLQVVAVDAQPITDQRGTYLSAYAPVRTSSGEVDAILGVNISLEGVLAYEQRSASLRPGLFSALATLYHHSNRSLVGLAHGTAACQPHPPSRKHC